MGLARIIYTSRASARLGREDLQRILDGARTHNAEAGITGYLLYDDGHFIQAIEGEADAVDALLARISVDDRHGDVEVLAREAIEAREFADWAMGWFHVDQVHRHDVGRLRDAMDEFLTESGEGIREAIGFFRLFLRFERETPT
jgi:hypothetical protein